MATMSRRLDGAVYKGVSKSASKSLTNGCRKCSNAFNIFYDVIAAIISICDVVTDFIILVQFYMEEKYPFFIASLIIIILANLSYCFVFVYRYQKGGLWLICCVGLLLLPFSPILSYCFYFMDDSDCVSYCCDSVLCFFNPRFRGRMQHNPSHKASKLRSWMESKASRHIGFILEAWIEAFPQSILQLIAICYYDEFSLISVISISLSMLSVSSKALILSAMTSINAKTMLFSWMCSVTDFFSIFMMISWLFYIHCDNVHIHNIVQSMQQLYLYKFCIFTLPISLCCSIVLFVWGFGNLCYSFGSRASYCGSVTSVCVAITSFVIMLPLCVFCVIVGSMALEICSFLYIAYTVYGCGHCRIPKTSTNSIWLKLIDFVKNAVSYNIDGENMHVSKFQDTIVRICCINRQLLLMKNTNRLLHIYLEYKEHETQYRDVKYQDIRDNCERNCGYLRKRFCEWYTYKTSIDCDCSCVRKCFFVGIFPLYLASKLINIAFPWIILGLLLHYNVLNVVHSFQSVMLFIALFFHILVILFFILIWKEEHILFHIAPELSGDTYLYSAIDNQFYRLFVAYYERLVEKPLILDILCRSFEERNIGNIIFEYIPIALEEEEHAQILTTNAVKYTQRHYDDSGYTTESALFRYR